MQWSGLILRTALAIGLIFNGSAYAFASVDMRMPMAHAGGGNLPTSASRVTASHTNAQPPCHDPSGTKSSSSQAADSTSHTGQASGATDQDLPDCCKSGNCRCACAHPMPVFVVGIWTGDAFVAQADNAQSMRSLHASPTLPHLIRPPIG